MPGAYVQSWQTTSSTTTLTSLGTSLSGVTAGNLLVAILVANGSTGGFDAVSGWTLQAESFDGDVSAGVYTRVADGAETSATFSFGGPARRANLTVAEYSGLDTTVQIEAAAVDDSYRTTASTTFPTGSATPLTANGLGIAFLGHQDERNSGVGEISIDSGYTIDVPMTVVTGAVPSPWVASKAYTTTAAQSATWSTTANADQGIGFMLVAKEAAAEPEPQAMSPLSLLNF